MKEASDGPTQVDGVALRDAAEILALVRADEQAAVRARRELRAGGLPRILADPEVAVLLDPDEAVVAFRVGVVVERHVHGGLIEATSGRLYLTTHRLLLVGRHPMSVRLADVEELSLAAEQLLITLRDATGLSFDAGSPRLLRVQVAAAVEAARTARVADPSQPSLP